MHISHYETASGPSLGADKIPWISALFLNVARSYADGVSDKARAKELM